eukprot:4659852-Prymnesium_polylepis.2
MRHQPLARRGGWGTAHRHATVCGGRQRGSAAARQRGRAAARQRGDECKNARARARLREGAAALGRLPQQKVGEAPLARRSDDEVDRRAARRARVEAALQEGLAHVVGHELAVGARRAEPPHRRHQLVPRRVREADGERLPAVALRVAHHRVHPLAQRLGHEGEVADDAHAHALPLDDRRLAAH